MTLKLIVVALSGGTLALSEKLIQSIIEHLLKQRKIIVKKKPQVVESGDVKRSRYGRVLKPKKAKDYDEL